MAGSKSLFDASSSRWASQSLRSYGIRVAALVLVLLVELLWLTIRFDTRTIHESSGVWGWMFQFAPRLSQLAIAMVAAGCLAGRSRLKTHWRDFSAQARSDSEWPHWLFFQVISYAMLLLTSSWLYEGKMLQTHLAGVVALEWILLAMATSICWMATVAPLRCWRNLLIAEMRYLVLGGLIGVGSLALAQSAQSLWEPLSDLTLMLVVGMLSCCFTNVVVDGATRLVGTSTFCVEIAPQCSGYEGVGLILVFLTAFCTLFRHRLRFPQAWLLWPLGILAIWLCNALRIALLIAVGTVLSPTIAMGGFHSQAGWIFFNGVALLLAAAALQIPYFTKVTRTTAISSEKAPVVWYLAPFLCLLALNLVITAFSGEFDWCYPVKIMGTCIVLAMLWSPESKVKSPARMLVLDRSCFPAILNGVLVFAIWVPLVSLGADQTHSQLPSELLAAPSAISVLWLCFRIFGSVVIVPFVEELAFRGYLMRRMVSDKFNEVSYKSTPWWAVIASSLLFGLMHQAWFAGTIAGIAYALAARRRNSLQDAIVAHAVTNGLIAAAVLMGNCWWLW